MAENGLFALYRLHQVDAELHRLRGEVGRLDTGKAESDEAAAIEESEAGAKARLRAIHQEQAKLETEQGMLAGKIQKLETALLDGSLHSEKDREMAAAEAAAARARSGAIDDRLFELLEESEAAAAAAKEEAAHVEGLRRIAAGKRAAAKTRHVQIKAEFDALLARRDGLAGAVPERLLKAYEPIRAKLGTGMAMVTDGRRCSSCGVPVPEKAYDMVRRDEPVACESCRRILFRLEQSS
jgi:predicted  nucleic acid-binding Zn-ribbon protein